MAPEYQTRTTHPPGVYIQGDASQPPLSPNDPTIGYKLNHFCVRIKDPIPTLHFYVDLLGMRSVFTLNIGPFTCYYLGYPQTDEHRADPKRFGEETFPRLAHTLGLIELYHIHGTESDPNFPGYANGNDPSALLGLAHFGFTIPDVPKALERLRKEGVEVVKDLGVATLRSIPISEEEEARGYAKGEIAEKYANVFRQIAFVRDPVRLSLLSCSRSRAFGPRS